MPSLVYPQIHYLLQHNEYILCLSNCLFCRHIHDFLLLSTKVIRNRDLTDIRSWPINLFVCSYYLQPSVSVIRCLIKSNLGISIHFPIGLIVPIRLRRYQKLIMKEHFRYIFSFLVIVSPLPKSAKGKNCYKLCHCIAMQKASICGRQIQTSI